MATVARATYGVYNAQVSGQVTVRWFIALGKKEEEPISGFFRTGQWGELPLLLETGRSKVTLFLNGGLGAFLERDAFFGAGDAFTQGNPVADDPATGGPPPGWRSSWNRGSAVLPPWASPISTSTGPYPACSLQGSARISTRRAARSSVRLSGPMPASSGHGSEKRIRVNSMYRPAGTFSSSTMDSCFPVIRVRPMPATGAART